MAGASPWQRAGELLDPWRPAAIWCLALAAGLLLCLAMLARSNQALRRQVRQRRAAKAELRDQLAFQRAMLEVIPHAVCVRDAQARLISCNAAYERLFQTTREAMAGQSAIDCGLHYASEERMRELHERYLRLMADNGTISEDVDISIGGEVRKIFHWAAPISLGAGQAPVALVAGAIDVTERHHLVEELELARLKSERANHAKTNFLATMSHEIRTPMNAVMGLLELLMREGRLVEQDRESAELARHSAQSLLGLIDDILDISKIEEGALTITPAPAQLRSIVNEVAKVFEGLARQRGLAIVVDIDPALGDWHLVDASRILQIANNLVSNAIKYTDSGQVTLRLRRVRSEEAFETVLLEVEDSGIGIAPEDIKNLFQPFFQAEAAGPRAIGGTGLGLPIVQRLCLKMGGTIDVRSQRGIGTSVQTRFRLALARDPGEADAAARDPQADMGPEQLGRGFTILAVDDHPANRLLLQRQLTHMGMHCVLAEDGEAALALWRAQRFDLVITDCSMPRMDGYALARAIRDVERREQRDRCPVLGCTAHVQEEDRRQAVEAGMDECLMKPFSLHDLSAALHRHLARKTAPMPEEVPTPAPQPLIIDAAALHSFTGGDPAIEARFADVLRRTNLADIEALADKVQAADWHEVAAGAHRIRGAARTVNAREVIECCETLERACAAADPAADPAAVAAAFAALAGSVEALNQALAPLAERLA